MQSHPTSAQQWVNDLAKNYRTPLVVVTVLRLLAVLSQITCFWFFCSLFNQSLILGNPLVLSDQIWMLGSGLLWIVGSHLAFYVQQRLEADIESDLQSELHSQWSAHQTVLTTQHSDYFWSTLALTHIPSIAQYISQYMPQKWLVGLVPVVILVPILNVNFVVSIILLVTMPLIPVFMILVGKGAQSRHQRHFEALDRLGSLFSDRVKGLRLISSFNRHEQEIEKLDRASQIVNERTMSVVSIAFLSNTVLDFFSTVSVALIAVFIGFSLLGELQLGPFIDFQSGLFLLLLAPLLFADLKQLGRLYHQKSASLSAADIIFPIINLVKPMRSNHSFHHLQWSQVEIERGLVTASELVLHKGDSILLTGASGSGKSMFLEGIMGLRESSHRLPGSCMLLSQKSTILPGSVRENMLLGHDCDDAAIWDALQMVELEQWVQQLPHGLSTPMGEHVPMSGGQAQRLGLARALLHQPDVLLLDEPTAHLSDVQHQTLSTLIHSLTHSTTVIWVSHRPLNPIWFDQTWCIEQGRLTCQ